ncbi:deoxyribonuclease 1 like 4, tandem duplicate 1 isoform X1 [Polyodon spathula]|uniref:deoxyribonuclease 1 like 4, tandem duplicate 1 isoform X1 n=1 Tax=Polyodon spathula TaxID=7913 RepID=UPI001B7D97DC|nr:deoxyribonuclease 1 like 4, tandem duplicate 1 isoform X1 [Polyodon spathula]XP_041130315.1 deoxyribonuclease 1 like 4, tandem duplicate 1 isoform X1 [Polyodon spathula]XP_041130316.1 deoxyribonuclease 1 like 4, tandem duplicate 1 isoform X1 [Polyodon spathula]XP_041130318.1 deoxyribonuclease 1 like 4, tandem duplicate 1 isoform X1 [Polyodon spathula]XP_041130319.1 deoxyribonuclease 1 like 4, tandem duplicate 1 isoform X1 [Polyodon spathula]
MKIASFNIQKFGVNKISNKGVLSTIIKIVSRYDIILILEVVDANGKAVEKFLTELNKAQTNYHYSMSLSPRLGRKTYKEQFLFLYRDDLVDLVDTYQYEDNQEGDVDAFAREPYIVRFSCKNTVLKDLVLIPVRANPQDSLKEIDELFDVFQAVKEKWKTDNVMILGDFHIEGRYISGKKMGGKRLRTEPCFHWLIGDDVNTTTSNKNKSYDRIVVYGDDMLDAIVPNSAKPFNFRKEYRLDMEKALNVSYHFPVEVELKTEDQINSSLGTESGSGEVQPEPHKRWQAADKESQSSEHLRIASFNIQKFGMNKISNTKVLSTIIKIVSRYDIILILEVVDANGKAVEKFLTELNKVQIHHHYTMSLSKRLGRKTYKEQFLFLYRDDLVDLVDTYQYEDNQTGDVDAFSREPYMVRFSCKNTVLKDLVLMPVHTTPKDSFKEIDELYDVFQVVKKKWKTDNIMILGDFNADGDYVSNRKMKKIRLRSEPGFHWLIGDDVDTTANTGNDNTYDRIVVYGDDMLEAIVPHSAKPFNFQEAYGLDMELALYVSDHYPVEVELKSAR